MKQMREKTKEEERPPVKAPSCAWKLQGLLNHHLVMSGRNALVPQEPELGLSGGGGDACRTCHCCYNRGDLLCAPLLDMEIQ